MLLFCLFLLIFCNKTKVDHAFFSPLNPFSFTLSYKHTEPDTWAFTKFQPGFIYSYCDKKMFDGFIADKKKKKEEIPLVFFQAVHKVVCRVSLAFVGRCWWMWL